MVPLFSKVMHKSKTASISLESYNFMDVPKILKFSNSVNIVSKFLDSKSMGCLPF